MSSDTTPIYNPWSFIHSDEFTTDIIIENVEETYSTGDPISPEGEVIHRDSEAVQFFSFTKEDEDEGDVHEQKYIVRFLATNTDQENRYLWVTDSGEVRTDGGFTNLATLFEVIHWVTPSQDNYQLICQGGNCKGYILYMDGASLETRKYHQHSDDSDITTKFQMTTRGDNDTVRAFISKTGVPIYFDKDGNYRPEGPSPLPANDSSDADTELHPLYFIVTNVQVMYVTSV